MLYFLLDARVIFGLIKWTDSIKVDSVYTGKSGKEDDYSPLKLHEKTVLFSNNYKNPQNKHMIISRKFVAPKPVANFKGNVHS